MDLPSLHPPEEQVKGIHPHLWLNYIYYINIATLQISYPSANDGYCCLCRGGNGARRMTGAVDGGGTMVGWINTIPVITKV